MLRFDQRESVLLGYSPQRSFEKPVSPSMASCESPDIDFNDVFGGPPRRSSIQEMRTRYSFGEQTDSSTGLLGKDEAASHRSRWSGLGEKPVFGDGIVNRNRRTGDDFFDDIFRGDDSYSSPRKTDRDAFASPPGSRVLSPTHPLPPKAEPFGTSLPVPFSLPAVLNKAPDLPGFSSSNRIPFKSRDVISNGGSHLYPQSSPLSRFSGQAMSGQDELKHDVQSSYCQSPLSNEFSCGNEESSCMTKPDEPDMGRKLNKESKTAYLPSSGSQFHFSIYKWASRGVPLLTPLRRGNSSRLKERSRTERCSSSNGRMESGRIVSELPKVMLSAKDSLFLANTVSANTGSSKMGNLTEENLASNAGVEICNIIEEAVLQSHGPKSLNEKKNAAVDELVNLDSSGEKGREKSKVMQEAQKPLLKPLHSLLNEELEKEGNVCSKFAMSSTETNNETIHLYANGDKISEKAERKKKIVKASSLVDFNKNAKIHDGDGVGTDAKKSSLQDSTIDFRVNFDRSSVEGTVKEFVKIFNYEAGSKPQQNNEARSHSSRWKGTGTGMGKANNGARISTTGTDKKMQLPNVNTMSDTSFTVEENLDQSGKRHSHIKITVHDVDSNSSGQKDGPSFSESISDGLNTTFGNIDEAFQGSFLVKELSFDPVKVSQSGEDGDVIRASETKIRQWSNGKNGNIRSLLSTLQYVLWPGSGWKSVPLVDLIESSAVKRAYQKALLCLHPDKLQQKGAATHQKYIAEKVFDILQEAWDHFNLLGSF